MKTSAIHRTSMFMSAMFSIGFSMHAQADSMLRIYCEGTDSRAEVTINGVFRGECPLDVVVPPGNVRLKAAKRVDAGHERMFEDEFRVGEGVAKRVEII